MLAALKALSYPDIDIGKNYKLKRQLEVAAGFTHNPFYKPWDHVVGCGDHAVPVRLFAPTSTGEHAVLLFFHGGGWVTGNIDSYDKVCHHMARLTNRMVVSVDYRLAPEHRFPAAIEDCYAVARDLYLDASLFGMQPEQIAIIGDSAGGNLAAAVSLLARDRGEFLPTHQILIYPATYNNHGASSPYRSIRDNGTDFLLTSKRIRDYMNLYISRPDDKFNPYFAPLLADSLENQPKTLVITAEFDPLRDEGEDYARQLANAGSAVALHRIPDALHGYFALSPRFAMVKRTYDFINAFLREDLP